MNKEVAAGAVTGAVIGLVFGGLIGVYIGESRKELEWQKYTVNKGKAEYRANQETGVVTWRWK
jgi:uncharacterized protein YcfJ